MIDSSICSVIEIEYFFSYFPRKFTEINSFDVNCMSKEQFPRSNYLMTQMIRKCRSLHWSLIKSDQRNYRTISIVYSFVVWKFQIIPDIVNDLLFKNLYFFATLFKLSNFWIFETFVDTITIYYFKLLSLLYRWCFLFFISCAMVRSANIFWRSLRTVCVLTSVQCHLENE